MSDERRPNIIWRFRVAGGNGTKLLRIELFNAAQWKFGARRAKRNMYPAIPFNADGYWEQNYRLRINGSWRQKEGYRFRFFTLVESLELAKQLIKQEGKRSEE